MMRDVRRRMTVDPPIGGVNIVPVIDLCLVLLVVLLILSPLLAKVPVTVALPKAHTAEKKETSLAISLSPTGELAFDTERLQRADLPAAVRARLKRDGPHLLVIIRADENVTYGELTQLLKEIKDAGAANVAIGTELIQENRPGGDL